MKIHGHVAALCERRRKNATVIDRRYKKGSAIIIVLVLMFVMGAVISDNGLVLHQLKQEIQIIEKKQIRQHEERLERRRRQTTENTRDMSPQGSADLQIGSIPALNRGVPIRRSALRLICQSLSKDASDQCFHCVAGLLT